MTTKTPKGAIPLHLDNTELRRELRRADMIITTTVSLLDGASKEFLDTVLIERHLTAADDPFASATRTEAIYRTSRKIDAASVFALTVLTLLLSALVIYSALPSDIYPAQETDYEHH